MSVEPVMATREPDYPRRDALLANRSILDDRQPQRWRTKSGFAAAVAMLLATGLGGCSDGPSPPAKADPFAEPGPSVAAASAWVESIFGPGVIWSASFACDAVVPPAYFSEDEPLPVFDGPNNLPELE